jgi:hypothetical protein
MQSLRALVPRKGSQQAIKLTRPLILHLLARPGPGDFLRRPYATSPSTNPFYEQAHSQIKQAPHIAGHQVKSPELEGMMAGPERLPGSNVNPYKGGPSALDKAMTMFLFTELVRGGSGCWQYAYRPGSR